MGAPRRKSEILDRLYRRRAMCSLWPRRHGSASGMVLACMWLCAVATPCPSANGDGAKRNQHRVRVVARLRPLPQQEDTPANPRQRTVLPLHQRLQLIQAREQCNRTASRRRLWEPRGGRADAWMSAQARVPEQGGDDERMSEAEAGGWRETEADAALNACVLSAASGENGHVLMCCPAGAGIRQFALDHVLSAGASQADTYVAAAAEAVRQFVGGRHACIFAYGQTGSGKSHTIFGASDKASAAVPPSDAAADPAAGIVPRACSDVLAAARELRARGGSVKVSISLLELYGESITNLLAVAEDPTLAAPPGSSAGGGTGTAACTSTPGIGAGIAVPVPNGQPHRKPVVAAGVLRGRYATAVESEHECSALLLRGLSARRRAATAMNERSSRAHTVLVLHLHEYGAEEASPGGAACESVSAPRSLCIVDLGGAEAVSKSILTAGAARVNTVRAEDVGARLKEAISINLGLLTLKKVVRALVADDPHVPYNEAKLTTLLRGALGGGGARGAGCYTAMLVTCSSADEHASETVDALRFGQAVSSLALAPAQELNTSVATAAALRELDAEMEVVHAAIRAKEKWLTSEGSVCKTVAEGGGGQSAAGRRIHTATTRIVGAEAEHARLEALLMRRQILCGAP